MSSFRENKRFTDEILYQWQKKWSCENIEALLKDCENDRVLTPYILKYLSKEGVTLECGCGLGQWVVYLSRMGFKMAGVEIVPEAVQACKRYFPDADVRIGDVRQLPFEDNTFSGYISIGVVEHMIEGPETTFQEMKRVMKPGGVAIILVPAFNYFMRIWYPIRNIFVSLFRENRILRKLLGKPALLGHANDFQLKLKEIKNQLRREFWPIIGTDPLKGPIFIEYKLKKDQISELLKKEGLEIIESAPLYHPYVFRDNFGDLFFKKNENLHSTYPELNLFGKLLRKMFEFFSPHFFNYVYIYVAKVKK